MLAALKSCQMFWLLISVYWITPKLNDLMPQFTFISKFCVGWLGSAGQFSLGFLILLQLVVSWSFSHPTTHLNLDVQNVSRFWLELILIFDRVLWSCQPEHLDSLGFSLHGLWEEVSQECVFQEAQEELKDFYGFGCPEPSLLPNSIGQGNSPRPVQFQREGN